MPDHEGEEVEPKKEGKKWKRGQETKKDSRHNTKEAK